ncbi:MAG: helix-turn-helix domain-containing protein [Nanoarchaeota archaeon]|nr:helix-turn-helix domain-containing protein [Nanoarchaeota archaeon]
MNELTKDLEEAGLSNKEAEVYIALLKNQPIGGGKLSKTLNMDRTHTYNVLKNLVYKGLASNIIKDKKTLFQASPPKNLLNQIQQKEQVIKSIIPKLESLETVKLTESVAKILQGKPGLRTIIRLLLESKEKEILVYGGTGKSYEILGYEMPHVAKETELLKIKGRIITSEKLRGHPFTKLPNFKIKFIEELTPSSTMIFGNRVSINVFNENPFVLLIEDKSVADSYRQYFEYLWKIASK